MMVAAKTESARTGAMPGVEIPPTALGKLNELNLLLSLECSCHSHAIRGANELPRYS
jgi:hypothetical protein